MLSPLECSTDASVTVVQVVFSSSEHGERPITCFPFILVTVSWVMFFSSMLPLLFCFFLNSMPWPSVKSVNKCW
jgi:hypothetical protein